ncbi:hypothetical protein GS506_24150 [Rhodococcus hoagii]|nr:hypothetical protein [Prescottella equi]
MIRDTPDSGLPARPRPGHLVRTANAAPCAADRDGTRVGSPGPVSGREV